LLEHDRDNNASRVTALQDEVLSVCIGIVTSTQKRPVLI
jgi:hypothetical protein